MSNKKTRKLNVEDVKDNEWYNLPEIALMLNVAHSTMVRRCHRGDLKASNLGTEKKAQFRVLGKDLLDYLNK